MQIAPGLYSMSQWKGGHVHAYLVDDGGSLTLIDTLFNTDASVVLDEIARAGKQITDLKHIIITHAHRSHVGGVATLLSGAAAWWSFARMRAERRRGVDGIAMRAA